MDDVAADVIGTIITMTATDTIGQISPTVNHLEIRSSNATRGKLIATAPNGIYINQVTGDLVLGTVTAVAGDVSLGALAGSIVNDVNDGSTRVRGLSIDLFAIEGSHRQHRRLRRHPRRHRRRRSPGRRGRRRGVRHRGHRAR